MLKLPEEFLLPFLSFFFCKIQLRNTFTFIRLGNPYSPSWKALSRTCTIRCMTFSLLNVPFVASRLRDPVQPSLASNNCPEGVGELVPAYNLFLQYLKDSSIFFPISSRNMLNHALELETDRDIYFSTEFITLSFTKEMCISVLFP